MLTQTPVFFKLRLKSIKHNTNYVKLYININIYLLVKSKSLKYFSITLSVDFINMYEFSKNSMNNTFCFR